MAEVSEEINRSNTICHYTGFYGFSKPNCNGCNVGDPKMVELLHLCAENGLMSYGVDSGGLKQDELVVVVGEDAVVDLAGGRDGWAVRVTDLDVIVAEGEAEHEEQNAVAVGVGVVENQDLGGLWDAVMG